ncbi:MAG: ABC transporter ATP-binding protein [Pseudomonadota bacterium]
MLTIDNLYVRFSSDSGPTRPMVDRVDLHLEAGRTLAVIGETGSGKTLLGLSVCNLLPVSAIAEGKVSFAGQVLTGLDSRQMREYLGQRIAYVPQSSGLSLNPTMRCDRQVAEVFRGRRLATKTMANSDAGRLLARLGLGSGKQYPHLLSGGMKQRVLVAIGLAAEPELLIADEPTKGLDSDRRQDIIDLFSGLRRHNPQMAILLITHDLYLAEKVADEVAVMYAGQKLEQVESRHFFAGPRHPYSRSLLAALPERGLMALEGIAPRPDEILAGCPFHPRCPEAMERCGKERPVLVNGGSGMVYCWRYA